jgi:D-glycero-alpha-D-manno-heptose-7-phosphate kinase
MIITRTPFRISFFGGGTDYPVWFKEHGGAVISTTIDKYCWITCRNLPPFFDHRYRIIYSQMEQVKEIEEIRHISVRECLKFMKIKYGVEIHHDGDLPARTGIGSSSSFTVGLLRALHALKGKLINKHDLCMQAVHVEQELNKENVGSQDQAAAAFGGFNRFDFQQSGGIQVTPITISREKLRYFQDHLVLFFTGFSRTASEIAKHQIENTKNKTAELRTMYQMVDQSIEILNRKGSDYTDFGRLLHESWQLKRGLSHKVSTSEIDQIYEEGRKAGALGGKLLGAGGGGFLLFFIEPEKRRKLLETFDRLLYVPFSFESNGSETILYNPNEYGDDEYFNRNKR